MNILKSWFSFPDGGVWSNLIASALWAIPTFIHLHKKLNRHHKQILERGRTNVRTRSSK